MASGSAAAISSTSASKVCAFSSYTFSATTWTPESASCFLVSSSRPVP
jgi:hypothetical protein